MAETVIKECNCKHEFQDKMYGKRKRVFNRRSGKTQVGGMRCTVCGSEKMG